MSEEHDSWLEGLGVNVSNIVDSVQTSASDALKSAENTLGVATDDHSGNTGTGGGGGTSSSDYQQGYQDGLNGDESSPGPRDGAALEDYNEGFARGHDEFTRRTTAPRRADDPNHSEGPELTLDQKYRAALQNEDWPAAAEYLNGFSRVDIQSRLSELTPDMVASLHQGALDNPRLGSGSQVAQMTRDTSRDPNTDDDPNTVFAGEHFKMKMLDGFTVGEIGGVGSFLFAIWDLDNNRLANYEFHELMITAGFPIADCGEGDWSATFTTPQPMQVDQFAGSARLEEGSLVLVGFWHIYLGAAGVHVKVPTFFNKSFGVDAGAGPFVLVQGSVKVFKGD